MSRAAIAVAVPVEETRIRSSSLWRDGVRRLRRNRLAVAGGVVIALLCFIAIFAAFVVITLAIVLPCSYRLDGRSTTRQRATPHRSEDPVL